MTSEIRTNSLKSRAGLSTVTLTDSGPIISGVVTATSFSGDGSNLTGISAGTSLSGSTNNTVCTVTGANAIQGEANLTFDGNDLSVTGTAPAINFIDTDSDDYKIENVQGVLKITDTTASADRFVINDNGTGYFLSNFQIGSTTSSPGATLHVKTSYPSLKVDSGGHASDAYVRIISGNAQNSRVDFGDSDDDDIGMIDYDHDNNSMRFLTNTSERLRIDSAGRVMIGTTIEGNGNADEFTISYINHAGVSGGDQGRCGMTIRSGDNTSGVTQNGYIYFSDGTSGSNESMGVVAYEHSTDSMYFSTAQVARLRIDQNGDLGLGIAAVPQDSGARTLHIHDSDSGSGARAAIRLTHGSSGSSASNGAFIGFDNNPDFYLYNQEAGRIRFGTNGNERMVIEAGVSGQKSGRVLIGPSVPTSGDDSQVIIRNNETNGIYRCLRLNNQSNNNRITMSFEGGGTNTGDIRINGSTTSYNSYSDYRLKENVVPLTDPITRLKTLKPYRFNFIASPHITLDGFFAHEVSPAVAEAVGGEKDEVDNDGNVVPQALDMAKLVPLLTASLQEAITRIETLEQENIALRVRVTNLEDN